MLAKEYIPKLALLLGERASKLSPLESGGIEQVREVLAKTENDLRACKTE